MAKKIPTDWLGFFSFRTLGPVNYVWCLLALYRLEKLNDILNIAIG